MFQNFFLFLLFFCSISTVFTQNCNFSIEGHIIDYHDNTILQNATIRVLETEKYSITDSNGYYKIDGICSSNIVIEITHLQCNPVKKKININKKNKFDFFLEHHLETLNEVLIKGELYNSFDKTTIYSKIDEQTISDNSSQTFGDALGSISGVSTLSTGSTIVKPVIHGLHSSRILIMNNGVRLEDQQWGVEHAPNVDNNSLSSISVIKGSNALKYGGDAIGGVIVTQPKRAPILDTIMGKVIIGGVTNGRGGNAAINVLKSFDTGVYLAAQGSFKKLGDAEAPDYILSNTGVNELNFGLRIGANKIKYGYGMEYSRFNTEIGILRASHTGNSENLVDGINADEPDIINPFTYDINPPRQEVTHQIFKSTFFKDLANFGKVDLQYDYQNNRRFEFDIRRGDDRNTASLDLELQTHSLLIDAIYDIQENYELKFGFVGRYQNNFPNPDTGVRRFIPDYDKFDFGTYFISSFTLNDKINIDAGFRYDFNRIDAKKFYQKSRWEERGYDEDFEDIIIDEIGNQFLTNPIYDFHNISGSLGVSYQLSPTHQFIFNYNLATRPPNPAELFSDGLHHSLARIELGDLRFTKEISNKFLLNYQYNTSKLNAMVDVYYNAINDFIFLAPFNKQETNRGFFAVWEYRQTEAAIYGFDTNITYTLDQNFEIHNQSALTIGENITENIPIIDIPAFNTRTTLTYKNAKWHYFKAALTNELVLEQTRFPEYNIEDVFIPRTGEFITIDTSTPPDGYNLWHLSLQNRFNIKNKEIITSLFVDNLLNTSYRNYLNQMRFFADDLGRNIRLQIQFNF